MPLTVYQQIAPKYHAFRWLGDNWAELQSWWKEAVADKPGLELFVQPPERDPLSQNLKRGEGTIRVGDWLIVKVDDRLSVRVVNDVEFSRGFKRV